MRRKSLPVLLTMLLLSTSVDAKVDLAINGLQGEQKTNVDGYLSSIPQRDYSTDLRFQSRLEKSISEALSAIGYYHPKFDFIVEANGQKLVVNVTPGEVMTVQEFDVVISGGQI